MKLVEVSPQEYEKIVANKGPVFCSARFLELNRYKVEDVLYYIGRDKKNRMAFAVGEKDKKWLAPFSAPFAVMIALQPETGIDYYWEFTGLLLEEAKRRKIQEITVFLQPGIYSHSDNEKIINALLGHHFNVLWEDLNYSLDLTHIKADTYYSALTGSARNKLNIALRSGLSISRCETQEEMNEAYEVIRINRSSKGYPLRMTREQVMDTVQIVDHDFFLVKKDAVSVAAAIVFHVTEKIVQIIYWGDIPEGSQYRPMNFFAFELIKYYQKTGIEEIDIGPSTENGIPNFGLCSFKESVGCHVSAKVRLSYMAENTGGGV